MRSPINLNEREGEILNVMKKDIRDRNIQQNTVFRDNRKKNTISSMISIPLISIFRENNTSKQRKNYRSQVAHKKKDFFDLRF